ncbi:MAG: hypothetical protein DHS20C08_24050 [Rhodomicrobium sp.]|nr:MAG: hypothetical protein DHS20C08_24050 [Rhodomicrobium sp.]
MGKDLENAIAKQRAERPPQFVDPSLILRVKMDGIIMEDVWEKLGLTLLSSDEDNTIVLFSSDEQLIEFRERLEAYDGPIPAGQIGRRFESFINRIADVGTLEPRDRLGVRMKEAGFSEIEDLLDGEIYTVDIELWEFGSREMRCAKADQIIEFIDNHNGSVFDHYSGPSITMIRVSTSGEALKTIFSIPEVAFVDLPPEPDIETNQLVELTLGKVPELAPADENLPVVAVLDSGLNDHPFLKDIILAHVAYPKELGQADNLGHGTAVSGVVALGDLSSQLSQSNIHRVAKLISIKVVTDNAQFPDKQTLPTQMRQAIESVHTEYGCRIFVISLGDSKAKFEKGRVGPWAATLDEIARELDVLIFISAGNRCPRSGDDVEEGVTHYPGYLLEEANELFEPAGAVNAVTVGSIAHANGLESKHGDDAHVQTIADFGQPSPFTRTGPGAAGIAKPDFIDYGGTMIFNAVTAQLQDAKQIASTGLITTNNNFFNQLLVSKSGTSISTPMLANKAAQMLRRFPDASANLIKALMAGSASVPEEADRVLSGYNEKDVAKICGNGVVDPLKAAYSDDHRVILYAEDKLEMDQFAVYQIPIPNEFQSRGQRTIRVSLSFDAPVRRTRAEYIGTKMNFRVVRGCPVNQVFEHFRTHTGEDTEPADIGDRFMCKLKPGSRSRDKNTLQTGAVTFSKDTEDYGDEYYLIVRCVSGWASEQELYQKFAVVVELEHQEQVQIYARLQARVNV